MSFRPERAVRLLVLLVCLSALVAPAAHAQASVLYFPATGHHLTDRQGFLSFWRDHAGEQLLGFPITEAFGADQGIVQYFERGRLEQQIDPASGASQVRSGRVAAEYVEALWRSFAPPPPHPPAADEMLFAESGHTLREPFLSFWRAAGGLELLGPPISEPLWELTEYGQRKVQYFERARLERDASMAGTAAEIQVSRLGRALALLRGIDITAVPNGGAENYGPTAALDPDVAALHPTPAPAPVPSVAPAHDSAAAPSPTAAPALPKPASVIRKRIVVNLTDQWLYAFEGNKQIYDAPVSTGRDGMNTPAGEFAIASKIKRQTMRGVSNGVAWVVPNVPHVMYIHDSVALHGTYWHNKFGTGARLSHGCINLSLDAAAWLFQWAPVGTPVKVIY